MTPESSSKLKIVLDTVSRKYSDLKGVALRMNGPFWEEVFTNFYGRAPSGNTDKDWEDLLNTGLPLLREQEA